MSEETEAQETPALSGTVQLARSALTSPEPSPAAEADSRRQVEALMQDAALSPRVLREAAAGQPRQPWWQRLQFWRK